MAALHVFLGMGKPGTAQAEEKVLIWGAGGAVGTYAVQFSKQVSQDEVYHNIKQHAINHI